MNFDRNQQVPGFSFFGVGDYMNKADGKVSVASATRITGIGRFTPKSKDNFSTQNSKDAVSVRSKKDVLAEEEDKADVPHFNLKTKLEEFEVEVNDAAAFSKFMN